MNHLRLLLLRLGRLDFIALGFMLALVTTGILFIYSAGQRGDDLPVAPLYLKQFGWAVLGFAGYLAAALIDYRRIGGLAVWLFLAMIISLVLVLIVGLKINGARRWLNVGGIPIQPSEFAKVITVLMAARHLSRADLAPERFSTVAGAAALVSVPFLLIAAEPDLGTAVIFVPTIWVLLLAAGVPMRTLLLIVLAGLLLMPAGWFLLDDYQKERVLVFLDSSRDPLGAGWNKIQSEIAAGSGGLHGKGYLQGTQNVLGFLPRTVAPTDFIFSVVAEETGFTGSVTLLGLYLALLGRMVATAVRAVDKFGQLLAAGLAALLFFHVFVNIGMTIGLLPITGLPLPLISYGGSFMASTMTALGLVQSVHIRRHAA